MKLGKGQFVCGHKKCSESEMMRTWEVNFAYLEAGEKKNALVKVMFFETIIKSGNHRNINDNLVVTEHPKYCNKVPLGFFYSDFMQNCF